MEHLERAGVHSGDSITMYPSQNVSDEIKAKILDYTKKIALELNVLRNGKYTIYRVPWRIIYNRS